jgi:hypothetical protein
VQTALYRFPCPRCGIEVESDDSVSINETHASDGALTRVCIQSGVRLLHECKSEPELVGSRAGSA